MDPRYRNGGLFLLTAVLFGGTFAAIKTGQQLFRRYFSPLFVLTSEQQYYSRTLLSESTTGVHTAVPTGTPFSLVLR
ncbi:hypothetical protein ACFQL7_16465 [Halocatena marina]|uniref:Secreted protein n=1 Tax=Halocatena marina TaxID=2934937 RepID=A0ABD5YVH8_9EURY